MEDLKSSSLYIQHLNILINYLNKNPFKFLFQKPVKKKKQIKKIYI